MPWHPKQAVRRSTPTGLFADLVRCATRLYNALNDRLREQHGIVTLVDAAEGTFAERLTELLADALKASPITAADRARSELRSVLERDHIGTPTG